MTSTSKKNITQSLEAPKWETRRVKSLIDYSVNGVWGDEPTGDGNDLFCVRVADFEMDKFGVSETDNTYRQIPISQRNGRLLDKWDVLIEKSGGGEKQSVGRAVSFDLDRQAVTSNFVGRLVCKRKQADSRFLIYLLAKMYSHGQNQKAIKQTTGIQNLDLDIYLNERELIPALDQQKSIAKYLDSKARMIDELVAKKEKMIELLKEERAAVINHAVTRGLDSKAALQDTGIEWLGRIPKHWTIKRLKFIAKINERALLESTPEEYEFNYVDIGNVDLENGYSAGEKIKFKEAPSRARRIVRSGDTIVSTVRTYLKAIAFIGEDASDLIVSTGFAVVSTGPEFNKRFIYYLLRSQAFIDRICALSTGVSYPAVNASDVGGINVWYPRDIREQQKISEFLDGFSMRVGQVISRINKEIDLLKEYRTALISEAVTGKIGIKG